MNRRNLIVGGMALGAAAALPKQIAVLAETAPTEAELMAAVNAMLQKIYGELWKDFTVYGNCYARQLEEYPYLERIPPEEWPKIS